MLKLAWYLITDLDYWQETARFPRPALVREPADRLTRLLSDEGPFTPAHTVAATDIMLQAAAYLSDAVRHGAAAVPDPCTSTGCCTASTCCWPTWRRPAVGSGI